MPREDLARCAALSTDENKLACFEGLLAPRAALPVETARQDADALEPVVARAPQAGATADGSDVSPPVPTTRTVTSEATEVLPEPDAPSDTLTEEFGREHVRAASTESEVPVVATVQEVSRDYTRRLVFHFENGQVWRQQEARRFQYPKNRAFAVEIARGVLGDYQLRVEGEGRMTRIKRVQ